MRDLRRGNSKRNQRGQILPMLALYMLVIILFTGLAIDLGFAYVTKANLSKAVDAAALAGMRNLSLGQAGAAAIATSAFTANYKSSGRDVSTPTPSVTWGTDPTTGLTQINVTASTSINTFFARILPQFQTLAVGDTAQSTRANVAMTLVLDRSASMLGNGGSTALPIAVSTFLTNFSDTLDKMALTSFASNATTDVTMRSSFTATIRSTVNGINFDGATFALGGMTLAKTQEDSVNTPNVLKVVVFFTDGIANTIQDNLSCPGFPLINYGGNAPSEGNGIWFMSPSSGVSQCSITNNGNPSCCNAPGFTSQQYGTTETYTTANITNEAEFRMLTLAQTMRTANPPTVIYSIGLGSDINQDFLRNLANDSLGSQYNSSQPSGMAVMASYCPGTNCTADLNTAFQTVATDILLRLTR